MQWAPEHLRSFADVVDRAASLWSDRIAFHYLENGEEESARLTFGELRQRALAVGHLLCDSARPGDRVLLLYPPGLDFIPAFLGCLYAGVIAVPLYAPHPRKPDVRLQAVVGDCVPVLALTTGAMRARCLRAIQHDTVLPTLPVFETDTAGEQDNEPAHRIRSSDIAFLQYTSGSTSDPKGVCVTHQNLVANEQMIQAAMQLNHDSVIATWLPTHHDMGLVGDTLQPIFSGCAVAKIPPTAFLQHPHRWLVVATKYRATVMGAPNFAYDLCATRVAPEIVEKLDLHRLRVTYCGSEPIRQESLHRFAETFARAGFDAGSFFPCYGLAEATLMVSGGPVSNAVHSFGPNVSCGQVSEGTEVRIVNPDSSETEHGIGEVWVRGPHIAEGYWTDAANSQGFRAFTAEGAGPFLRTGDLGFVRDGELYVTGRLKDLLIVRGRNHYPQDIEHTASMSHPSLVAGRAAAFQVDSVVDDAAVVVVHEISHQATALDMVDAERAIRVAVADRHDLPLADVLLVVPGVVPRTTSGKVRRRAARVAYQAGHLTAARPSNAGRELQDC